MLSKTLGLYVLTGIAVLIASYGSDSQGVGSAKRPRPWGEQRSCRNAECIGVPWMAKATQEALFSDRDCEAVERYGRHRQAQNAERRSARHPPASTRIYASNARIPVVGQVGGLLWRIGVNEPKAQLTSIPSSTFPPQGEKPVGLVATRSTSPVDLEPVGDLTLRQALALALTRSPELAAFSQEIRAREAAVLQARLLPNPTLSTQTENFGNPALQGFDGHATTVSLSQLIELGGKRAARIKAAWLAHDLAGWDYEIKRIEVLTRVAQTFVEVLSAQERLALAEQMQHLAEQVMATVSKRVEAGRVSPVEETKAKVALASVQIDLVRTKRELEATRKRLAATWGSTKARFKSAVGDLERVFPIPALSELIRRLSQNPDLARWAIEITQRQAFIELEKTRAIPDITASFGVRQFHETGDNALIAEVSIPLPLFNRNQGAILEAQERLVKAEQERRATKVQVEAALTEAYQRLAAAHIEVITLKTQVLPSAQSAFEAANEGYRLGKFAFLDVLDAQRTLFAAKAQYLRAAADYHQAVAAVERLIGERLEAMPAGETQKDSR